MTAIEYKPMKKMIQPINFLFFRTETTLTELGKFFHIAPELYDEASTLKLRVTGPIHWHYLNFTSPADPFRLEIALPIADSSLEYDGKFHFKRTENFTCISIIHEGNWLEMGARYEQLVQLALANKLTPSGTNRELYMNVDFVNPSANVTELQLGVF